MNSDSENFEQLRRLLALKRHEQPPPGYFNDFSSQVLARIRAGERQSDRAPSGAPWWHRLWGVFEAKPVFAGAFGAAVCAVLVSGILTEDLGGSPVTTQVMPVHAETFAGGVPPVPIPPEFGDTNYLALKKMFDGFPLPAQPVSFNWPQ